MGGIEVCEREEAVDDPNGDARAGGRAHQRYRHRAPHPNAALLFYDFMLSIEAQKLMLAMEYVPTNTQVPSPLTQQRFTLVDPAVAPDQRDKWARSFEEVILKRGRQ